MNNKQQNSICDDKKDHDIDVRAHRVWILVILSVLFWVIVGAIHCYVLWNKDKAQLNSTLWQTVTTFRHSMANYFESMGSQVDFFAMDECWNKLLATNNINLEKSDKDEESQKLYEHLQTLVNNSDGSILLLLNDKKQILQIVEKSSQSVLAENVTSIERGAGVEENTESGDGIALGLPALGTVLDSAPINSAYEFAESQSGYLRFSSEGAVLGVIVRPLLDGKKIKGAIVLGEVISDKLLGECSQGMLNGVLAVVVNHEVVAAFDKRTARRPAPLLVTSISDTVKEWNPASYTQKISLKEGESDVIPEPLMVAGREWNALTMELIGAGKNPIGWVLFLGDTSASEDILLYNIWFMIGAIALFIPFIYGLAWRLSIPKI